MKAKITIKHYHDVIWGDYDISRAEFEDILNGKKENGWLNQEWALRRVIENVDYYTLIESVPLELIAKHWDKIKPKIYNKQIIDGLEYILRKYPISPSG
ncbi:MAG: hypothetical protein ACOCXT_04045 [Candidatus Dojkabacteria bacterium]